MQPEEPVSDSLFASVMACVRLLGVTFNSSLCVEVISYSSGFHLYTGGNIPPDPPQGGVVLVLLVV